MATHICSFASKNFLSPQNQQLKALYDVGFSESNIHALTELNLGEDFYRKIPYASEKNKFGFFSFKPYAIEQLLLSLSENDILIYIDVNDRPLNGIKDYVEKKMAKEKNINILATSTNYPNIKHSSCFHQSRFSFYALVASFMKFQPEAGALIIRNNRESRALLRAWTELTLINSDSLVENDDFNSRHDQETLFLLSLVNNSIKFESWYIYRFLKKGFRKYIQWEHYRKSNV